MVSEEFMDEIIESEIEQMDEENKFREYKLVYNGLEGWAVDNQLETESFEDVHVIEYAAFEQLKAENLENTNALINQIKLRDADIAALKSEIDRLNNKYDYQLLVKSNDALKADLKIIRETLEGQRAINDRQHGTHVKEVEQLKSKLKTVVQIITKNRNPEELTPEEKLVLSEIDGEI